jgi:Tol biopolymer transport system component
MVFSSRRNGTWNLYTRRASGGGLPDSLYDAALFEFPSSWSPDGRWILATVFRDGQPDIIAIPADGEGEPIEVANSQFSESQGKFSPDGRWVAYHSQESGAWEIYVQAFPEADGKWQISMNGGLSVQWRSDGTELYYLTPGLSLMAVAVEVDGSDGFQAGVPRQLFQARVRSSPTSLNRFIVSKDGQRFLFNARETTDQIEPVTVVLNWLAELEDR